MQEVFELTLVNDPYWFLVNLLQGDLSDWCKISVKEENLSQRLSNFSMI